jgi:hypothetical protein
MERMASGAASLNGNPITDVSPKAADLKAKAPFRQLPLADVFRRLLASFIGSFIRPPNPLMLDFTLD